MPVVRETMEGALPLDVPLTVDVKVGDDWESMTPLRAGLDAVPELPEVETVARDLRGLIVGATIIGAAGDWARTIASHATRGVRRRRGRAPGRGGRAAGEARRRGALRRRAPAGRP